MDVPPPATDAPPAPQIEATIAAPATGVWAALAGVAIIPILVLIAFHVGAGYLSYQKYGSVGWAFLDFLFAYFYYPYYAFFLAKDPGPSAQMFGGKRGLVKMMLGKWFK